MKDPLCSYYTESTDITETMVALLGDCSHSSVLEPSAGSGVFVDALLQHYPTAKIDAVDIDQDAVNCLKAKYATSQNVHVRTADTLFDDRLDSYAESGGFYDKIIGNPPYGAWQDYERRSILKKKYPGYYVKETYSLFLLRCLSLLKDGGSLCFIIPDTFLFLNLHASLRGMLLTTTKMDSILLFPSKFFPGASFAYSNMAIVSLSRCDNKADAVSNSVKIVRGFMHPEDLLKAAQTHEADYSKLDVASYRQEQILRNPQHSFILASDDLITLINDSKYTLGDVANVVTGLYTGDNKTYIRVSNSKVKGSKGYKIVDISHISHSTSIDGVVGSNVCYVPYIKSAPQQRYVRESDDWFVRWDTAAVKHYREDKKARFQNSDFYFKEGVGIPMVKSKTIRAFLMRDHVFDQSIVGLFPHDRKYLKYLLALMNSGLINELLHLINPTANNSSNYVKRLPFVYPDSDTLTFIDETVDAILCLLARGHRAEADALNEKTSACIKTLYFDN